MPQKLKTGAKKWCLAHKKGLLLAAAGLVVLTLFYIARQSRAAMDAWVQGVSMPVKRAVSALVDPLPFSFCELCATAAILVVLAGLFYSVWLAVRRRKSRFGAWILHTATAALWVWVLVCALWGTQYYAATFAEQAGMTAGPVSVEALCAATQYFARQVNATAIGVPRAEGGTFDVSGQEILARSNGLYDGVLAEYPFLAGPERTAKPAFYSRLMSAWGFTGYLCPLFGESTVNVDSPTVFLPATVAHEFAHQRGVAAEQEANFCGVEACVASGDPVYKYSGWLFGFLHLNNALYAADQDAWAEVWDSLCPEAKADLAENNAYWAAWEGPVQETGSRVYTAMLESYGQELGMKSYGACVDLLVEKYAAYNN